MIGINKIGGDIFNLQLDCFTEEKSNLIYQVIFRHERPDVSEKYRVPFEKKIINKAGVLTNFFNIFMDQEIIGGEEVEIEIE